MAQKLAHPLSLAVALGLSVPLQHNRAEARVNQELAEAQMALSTEHGFPFYLAQGTIIRGWALAEQGKVEEGIAQIHQGLAAWRALGAELSLPYYLGLLAEAYGRAGQVKEGLTVLTKALDLAHKTGERKNEALLYWQKGALLLHSNVQGLQSKIVEEADMCFHKAMEIARRQEAKAFELRAAISLSLLWQQQGKRAEAYELLAPIYGWFTEGFDTADLQEAKTLLEELAG